MSERLNVMLEFYRDNDRMIETAERINDSYLEMLDALEVLEAENAKLRELCADISRLLFPLDVDYCAACPRDDINYPCPVHTVKGGECLYETDLRELGVDV